MGAVLFSQGKDLNVTYMAISILATFLTYGAFPFIYARVRKKPITASKYSWTCFGINFLLKLLLFLIDGSTSFLPYLLWTFLFTDAGKTKLSDKGLLIESPKEKQEEQPANRSDPLPEKANPPIMSEAEGTEEYAGEHLNTILPIEQEQQAIRVKSPTGIEKRHSDFRGRIGYAILVLFSVSAIAIAAFSAYRAAQYKSQIEYCQNQLSALNKKMDEMGVELSDKEDKIEQYKKSLTSLQKKNDDAQQEAAELRSKVRFYDEHIVFVTSDDSFTYHKYDCIMFQYSNSDFWAYNEEAAIAKGIRPCWFCFD